MFACHGPLYQINLGELTSCLGIVPPVIIILFKFWTSFCHRAYSSLCVFLFSFFLSSVVRKKKWGKICMRPQFGLCCHASVVWLQQNNEKLKGNLWFAVHKPWKFHGTVCKPGVPLSHRDDRQHREDWEEKEKGKKKPSELVGLTTSLFVLNSLPFVVFYSFSQEFRLFTSDSLLCLQALPFLWGFHFSC